MAMMRATIDDDDVERADDLIDFVKGSPFGKGISRVTRSAVYRVAYRLGLSVLESSAAKAGPEGATPRKEEAAAPPVARRERHDIDHVNGHHRGCPAFYSDNPCTCGGPHYEGDDASKEGSDD